MNEGEKIPTEIFGDYALLRRIASSDHTECFVACAYPVPEIPKLYLLKRATVSSTRPVAETLANFKAEYELLNPITAPGFARVLRYGEHENTPYLIRDFVEGRSLQQVNEACLKLMSRIPIAMTLRLVAQAAGGLAAAHAYRDRVRGTSKPFVHREIHPAHLLLAFDGGVYWTDFAGGENYSRRQCGYLSPEQVAEQSVSPSSNLFSLGVLAWEMLTRKRLFVQPGDKENETLTRIRKCDHAFMRPSGMNGEVPLDVDEVVMKALQRDPTHRYATAEEFQVAITRVLQRNFPESNDSDCANFLRVLFDDEWKIEQAERLAAFEAIPASAPGPVVEAVKENTIATVATVATIATLSTASPSSAAETRTTNSPTRTETASPRASPVAEDATRVTEVTLEARTGVTANHEATSAIFDIEKALEESFAKDIPPLTSATSTATQMIARPKKAAYVAEEKTSSTRGKALASALLQRPGIPTELLTPANRSPAPTHGLDHAFRRESEPKPRRFSAKQAYAVAGALLLTLISAYAYRSSSQPEVSAQTTQPAPLASAEPAVAVAAAAPLTPAPAPSARVPSVQELSAMQTLLALKKQPAPAASVRPSVPPASYSTRTPARRAQPVTVYRMTRPAVRKPASLPTSRVLRPTPARTVTIRPAVQPPTRTPATAVKLKPKTPVPTRKPAATLKPATTRPALPSKTKYPALTR